MASDDVTSQDSIVIGDDLVEALGFEPIVHDDSQSFTEADDHHFSAVDTDFPSVELLSSIEAPQADPLDRASHEAEAETDMAIDEAVEVEDADALLSDDVSASDDVSVHEETSDGLSSNSVIDLSDSAPTRRTVFGRFASRQRDGAVPDGAVADGAVSDNEIADDAESLETVLGSGEDGNANTHVPPPPTMDDLITFVADDDAPITSVAEPTPDVDVLAFDSIEIPRYEFPDLVVTDAAGGLADDAEAVGEPSGEGAPGEASGSDERIEDESGTAVVVLHEEPVAVPIIDLPPLGTPAIETPTIDPPTIDLNRIDLSSDEIVAASPLVETAPALRSVEVVIPSTSAAVLSKRRQRLRARKTRRVIRHIDPWSALKFSIIFHLCFFAALLLASVLVWNAAVAAGTIENIESFVRELGDYEKFEIDSNKVFTAAMLIAGMLTLASTIMVVLLTVVFNLISDLVGGIRVTVIEEDTVRVPDPPAAA